MVGSVMAIRQWAHRDCRFDRHSSRILRAHHGDRPADDVSMNDNTNFTVATGIWWRSRRSRMECKPQHGSEHSADAWKSDQVRQVAYWVKQ